MKVKINSIVLILALFFLFTSCKKDNIEVKLRLTEIVYVESQWKMEIKYNSDGRIVSTIQNGGDSLFYDNLGRLIKYDDSYVTYAFDYNTNGQIIKKTPISTILAHHHPDTIEYHYDALGRMTRCTSTFNDQNNIPQQGWIRNYSYNDQGDITTYSAIHQLYNQTENEVLSYDKGTNPLKLSNSILFFLNEHFYEVLNQHIPKRKDSKDFVSLYLYDYSSGTMPKNQTIKFYSPGQPLDPLGYKSMQNVRFTYE